jgi:hypothetical protein
MDLAGHHGRHEEREGGCREEKVDPAAADAERGADRANNDEDSKQHPWLLARCQGGNGTEDGTGGQHKHGHPGRHLAKPARGTSGLEAVETDPVASGPVTAGCCLSRCCLGRCGLGYSAPLAGRAWPPGEIIGQRTAPVVAVRIPERASLSAARCP